MPMGFSSVALSAIFTCELAQCTPEILLVSLWWWISERIVLSQGICHSLMLKAQFYTQFYSAVALSELYYKGLLSSDTRACRLDKKNEGRSFEAGFSVRALELRREKRKCIQYETPSKYSQQ